MVRFKIGFKRGLIPEALFVLPRDAQLDVSSNFSIGLCVDALIGWFGTALIGWKAPS